MNFRTYVLGLMQSDTLQALVVRHAPDVTRTRNERLASQHPTLPERVQEAIDASQWRRVASLAAEAITTKSTQDADPGDVGHLLSWWHLRLVALWKLRLFALVHTEFATLWQTLEGVQGAPDEGPLVKSSSVPFALHVFHAQALFVHGQQRAAVARLWQLLQHCAVRKAELVWQMRDVRLRLLLASALIEMEAYDAAATVVDPLADPLLEHDLSSDEALHSLVLARLYLAMGCVARAEALVAAASQAPAHAQHNYENLVRLIRDPHTASIQEIYTEEDNPMAVNTAAVRAFYHGDLDAGVAYLETYLATHPTTFATTRGLAGNLVTLHTMGLHDGSTERQRMVRRLVQVAGDDPTCVDSRMG